MGYSLNDKYYRIVGFGHPDLIRLMLHEGVSLFVDTTFKVTPAPFNETVIIMVHDRAHNIYVPFFWVLSQSKDQWSYKHILGWVKIQCGMKCKTKSVVCGFEHALDIAVKDPFRESFLIGCLFHWKWAIRRKLKGLHIPRDAIKKVMAPGCLDVLTVVPENLIRKKSIPYVIRKIKKLVNIKDHKVKWDEFWNYFVRTRMDMYPISSWNISSMTRANVDIVTTR